MDEARAHAASVRPTTWHTHGGVQAAAWLVTRAGLVWAALSWWYGHGTGSVQPWSDVRLYLDYGSRILDGAAPYADVAIEYPLGVLPLLVVPALLADGGRMDPLLAFVLCTVLVDLVGFLAAQRLGQRWGSSTGTWTWIVGGVAVGPLLLVRLDLLPVVAVLWAVERAAAGRWAWTGGLLVTGAATKLWPGGLLPAAAVAAPRWRRVVAGAAVATVGFLAVDAGMLAPMLDAAVFRNLERGLQMETLWGSLLLAGEAMGITSVEVAFAYGADEVSGPGSTALLQVARVVPLVVVGLGTWLAARPVPGRSPAAGLAHAVEAATLLLVTGASVLSAQFVVWALGAVTVVACLGGPRAWRRPVLVGAACVLTAIEFPWGYDAVKEGAPWALTVLLARNLLLVAATASAIRDTLRPPADGSVAQQ